MCQELSHTFYIVRGWEPGRAIDRGVEDGQSLFGTLESLRT